MKATTENWVSPERAAAKFGLDRNVISRMIGNGEVRYRQQSTPGGGLLVDVEHLERWLRINKGSAFVDTLLMRVALSTRERREEALSELRSEAAQATAEAERALPARARTADVPTREQRPSRASTAATFASLTPDERAGLGRLLRIINRKRQKVGSHVRHGATRAVTAFDKRLELTYDAEKDWWGLRQ